MNYQIYYQMLFWGTLQKWVDVLQQTKTEPWQNWMHLHCIKKQTSSVDETFTTGQRRNSSAINWSMEPERFLRRISQSKTTFEYVCCCLHGATSGEIVVASIYRSGSALVLTHFLRSSWHSLKLWQPTAAQLCYSVVSMFTRKRWEMQM